MTDVSPPDAGDVLVPERQFRLELGDPSNMTWWRWRRDPELAIPAPVKIRGRCFQWRSQIEATKARLASLNTAVVGNG